MENPTNARMRTIKAAVDEIRASDPHTAISFHGLRQAVLQGRVPYIQIGKKRLIDVSTVLQHLYNANDTTENEPISQS